MMVLGGPLSVSAQEKTYYPTSEEIIASMQVSRNILKLINAMPGEFSDVKGAFITKTADSTSVYAVKDIKSMLADNQYVMEKHGKTYYIAYFARDPKKQELSLTAFTNGVKTIVNGNPDYLIEEDKAKSTADKQIYTIRLKGAQVGSYTIETAKKESTMIIGAL